MSVLARAKKVRLPGKDWQLIKLNASHIEMLVALGLLPKPQTQARQTEKNDDIVSLFEKVLFNKY